MIDFSNVSDKVKLCPVRTEVIRKTDMNSTTEQIETIQQDDQTIRLNLWKPVQSFFYH